MKNMDRYAQRILTVLHRNSIGGMYNEEEKLVYAYRRSGYEEIFCIYQHENGIISSCAIYSLPVLDNKKECVLNYLASINKVNREVDCYIDSQSSCVAFSTNYHIPKDETAKDTAIFEQFCIKACNMLMQHQQALDDMINED